VFFAHGSYKVQFVFSSSQDNVYNDNDDTLSSGTNRMDGMIMFESKEECR
jgi:hypothetical protein